MKVNFKDPISVIHALKVLSNKYYREDIRSTNIQTKFDSVVLGSLAYHQLYKIVNKQEESESISSGIDLGLDEVSDVSKLCISSTDKNMNKKYMKLHVQIVHKPLLEVITAIPKIEFTTNSKLSADNNNKLSSAIQKVMAPLLLSADLEASVMDERTHILWMNNLVVQYDAMAKAYKKLNELASARGPETKQNYLRALSSGEFKMTRQSIIFKIVAVKHGDGFRIKPSFDITSAMKNIIAKYDLAV